MADVMVASVTWRALLDDVARLEAKNAELKSQRDIVARTLAVHADTIVRLEAENAKLRAVLREVQWRGSDEIYHSGVCPACGAVEPGEPYSPREDHYGFCPLAALLGQESKE